MATMQAAHIKVPFQFEVREVPIPEVRPGWALVKVEACGICGTDLHYARHLATEWQGFGHEVAGVITALGAGISHVKEGDHVVLESGSYCGVCEQCRNGHVDLCNKAPNFWNNPTMGFADYILAPAQCLVPYDSNRLSPEVACLSEPLGVALDITYVADIPLGSEVLVLGLGPIGLMTLPLVRMKGAAHVYAANRSGGKRAEVARRLGADTLISTGETPLHSDLFRKGGVDRALISASPAAIVEAMPIMRYGGILAFIGIEYGDGARISFDVNDFHFKKLQLRASHAAPALYFPTCLQLMMDGQVDGPALVSHIMPLEQIGDAMRMVRDCREDVLKVVIKP
ncbi:MAG: zinc-binding dehydrogenase [Anaerolineae bacterium]